MSGVSLEFHAGEIHALLGENGAGKSTLIKMLAGVTAPSEGEILVDGAARRLRSVRDGQSHGIVALPQELSLVPTLGAAENIFLGLRRPGSRLLVDRRALDRDATALLERLGQRIPLDVPAGELSAVQQTMIALARALARDARVLILDEPTAALTEREAEQLFAVLRTLREAGTAIVYVSHRLEEVFALADTATVLLGGRHVWTRPAAQTSADDAVAAMIGRPPGQIYPQRETGEPALQRAGGPAALEVRDLRGHTLAGVSLQVPPGRVLGIGGLAGSGRSELLALIAGAQRPRGGAVLLGGQDITARRLAGRMRAGIVLVPEERRSQGLVMTHSVQDNIALANLGRFSRLGIASRSRERAAALRRAESLRIRATSIRQPVEELSGGNQQKVVLAKYLERSPRVLLLDEPTRGIDVGTKAEIYQLVRRLAAEGVAVLVVSSEIPELLGVADEIAVLHEGRLAGLVPAATATEESVLHLCYRKSA
nr:sugar ABC transporter ATP-binding protein [Sediminivirga luteola]